MGSDFETLCILDMTHFSILKNHFPCLSILTSNMKFDNIVSSYAWVINKITKTITLETLTYQTIENSFQLMVKPSILGDL